MVVQAEPSSPGPLGRSGADLVGRTLLVTAAGTPEAAAEVTIGCLLLAQHQADSQAPPTQPGDGWSGAFVRALASMGWVVSLQRSNSRTLGPAATSAPWSAIREDLSSELTTGQATALDGWVGVLRDAAPDLATRWRQATLAAPPGQVRSVQAVAAAQDGGECLLVVDDVRLSYGPDAAPTPLPAFPWGDWPSNGATLTLTVAVLVLAATTVPPLLAAVRPKVAGVLPTEVTALTAHRRTT